MKKTFDAVAWMRQRREEIDLEDQGLTWDDKRRKTHDIVLRDPLLAPLCSKEECFEPVVSTVGTKK